MSLTRLGLDCGDWSGRRGRVALAVVARYGDITVLRIRGLLSKVRVRICTWIGCLLWVKCFLHLQSFDIITRNIEVVIDVIDKDFQPPMTSTKTLHIPPFSSPSTWLNSNLYPLIVCSYGWFWYCIFVFLYWWGFILCTNCMLFTAV